jgi:hypothetical protein
MAKYHTQSSWLHTRSEILVTLPDEEAANRQIAELTTNFLTTTPYEIAEQALSGTVIEVTSRDTGTTYSLALETRWSGDGPIATIYGYLDSINGSTVTATLQRLMMDNPGRKGMSQVLSRSDDGTIALMAD